MNLITIEQLANARYQVVETTADGFSVLWEGTGMADALAVADKARCQAMPLADLAGRLQTLTKHLNQANEAGQTWIAAGLRELLDTALLVYRARRVAASAAPAPVVVWPVGMEVAA